MAVQRGFTLLELLVAIAIFAVIAAIAMGGYVELQKQNEHTQDTLARVSEIQRAVQMITQDLEQLEPRPVREPIGDGRAPAFVVEKRHLAEGVARTEHADPAGDRLNAHVAVGDDHEADTAFAPDDDLVPGGMADGLHLLLDRADLGFRDAPQQLGVLELAHGQILIRPRDQGPQAFFLRSRNSW